MASPKLYEGSYEGQKQYKDGSVFLTMFVPTHDEVSNKFPLEELVALVKEHKSWLKEKLLKSGAFIFRGWDVKDGKDFAAIVESFGYKDMPYFQGEARRNQVHGPVFTASELPLHLDFPFHSEMAYLAPNYPDVIMFFCEISPPQGGGTAFVRGDVAYQRLVKEMPEFVSKLEKHGVTYSYAPQKGWETTFETTDKTIAQARAKEVNSRLEWNEETGESTIIRGPFPATRIHQGRTTWFNSLGLNGVLKMKHLFAYGDGTPIAAQDIKSSLDILTEEQSLIQWQAGDVVITDNLGVMHARLPGKPPRRVLVALGKE